MVNERRGGEERGRKGRKDEGSEGEGKEGNGDEAEKGTRDRVKGCRELWPLKRKKQNK